MTSIEAITKIGELLTRLVKLSKDRETSLLIQQIQEHQLLVHKELLELRAENAKFKAQLQDKYPKAKLDPCPFCHEPALRLIEIKGSPNPHFASMGFKQAYYKCDSCGQTYDKEVKQ
jgi:hypothetical protein